SSRGSYNPFAVKLRPKRNATHPVPNNSFKPNLLRSTKAMAGKACHGFGSTTQVGLTQALGATDTSMKLVEDLISILSAERPRLEDALIKAQILAHRLGEDELRAWVDSELRGYP